MHSFSVSLSSYLTAFCYPSIDALYHLFQLVKKPDFPIINARLLFILLQKIFNKSLLNSVLGELNFWLPRNGNYVIG